MTSGRFKKEDWLALGAKRLAEEGSSALTIERLTAAARRTKGSFYHHFADRDAFLRALMERWRVQAIDVAGARFAQDASHKTWRKLLRAGVFEIDFRFEREVRRLAASEPIVRAVLQEVDYSRIHGLACLLTQMRPDIDDPQAFACIQYATVIGLQWLIDDPSDPRAFAISRVGNRLFGLDEPEES
ncbi:TetR/AcrR family transcriptional regulator [Methylosinus sp. Sm6]|uniref:TetR/AcrR family transcriptional regulator n=1 Tax=Methylosinus sp. Sm6 TaxID=2866948 RepID=UPI001C993676|nr:TetR/AcrR family transcriptional regulator [Methylosinus sp. Sm6]MBY6243574.1 TetR/AcrR family transcriptional regulator [Methylosinus sp. Sm6]